MSRAVQELYEIASELAPQDRAELAGLLLESIEEPSDDGLEEAWATEIERRMAEFRAGRVGRISPCVFSPTADPPTTSSNPPASYGPRHTFQPTTAGVTRYH